MPTPAQPTPPPPPRSLVTLLTDLIDYAGLFPPAKLAMPAAAEAYNRARISEHEWALGRFVCPAAQLEDFSKAAAALMPGTLATSGYQEQLDAGSPWRVSALVDATTPEAFEADIDHIFAFNARHETFDAGLGFCDMIEVKVPSPDRIDACMDRLPEDIYPFFEFPVDADCRGYVAALAGERCAAKIRTGGVLSGLFPTPDEVATFLAACAAADVPFKATAGLHHPIRARNHLTFEPDSPTCTMHGFLNLFIAAAFLKARKVDHAGAVRILSEEDASAFTFADDFLNFREFGIETAQLAHFRETFALSFGSCSFDEPIADLAKLKLL